MRRIGGIAKTIGILAAVAAVGAAGDALVVEPYRMTVSRIELPPGPLAEVLGGERLVHLSDLHVKGMGLREHRLLASVQEADPALVLMTGDYADTPEGIEALREIFSRIRPRLGVVGVPGNNDYFRGRHEEIFAALRESGVVILRNDSILLRGRGGTFAVAGVDDPFFGRDRVDEALADLPPGRPAILLTHSPSLLLERAEAILFNAGDADGPWGEGWFWTDGSHIREPAPALRFESLGPHRLRIQRREDGVGVGAIRLVPAEECGPPRPVPAGRQGVGLTPPPSRGAIGVDLCAAADGDLGGSWRLQRGPDGGCILRDAPDRGVLASYPKREPEDRVDLRFEAPSDVLYRVWVRLHSPTMSGLSDSIYIQFADAVDEAGEARFRIDGSVPPAIGLGPELILAGHTHGGQVRLPWFGAIEKRINLGPFVMGRYDVSGTMVYVSRGIGTSYLPVRFACAPEVVVLVPPDGEAGS